MTVIAFNGTTVAADMRLTDGTRTISEDHRKLHRVQVGKCELILAYAGYVVDPLELYRWAIDYIMHRERTNRPAGNWVIGVFTQVEGELSPNVWMGYNDTENNWGYPERIHPTGNLFALGSGSAYALGAMSAGANPSEACAITANYEQGCNPHTSFYNFDNGGSRSLSQLIYKRDKDGNSKVY